jgi:hypothetical protein
MGKIDVVINKCNPEENQNKKLYDVKHYIKSEEIIIQHHDHSTADIGICRPIHARVGILVWTGKNIKLHTYRRSAIAELVKCCGDTIVSARDGK